MKKHLIYIAAAAAWLTGIQPGVAQSDSVYIYYHNGKKLSFPKTDVKSYANVCDTVDEDGTVVKRHTLTLLHPLNTVYGISFVDEVAYRRWNPEVEQEEISYLPDGTISVPASHFYNNLYSMNKIRYGREFEEGLTDAKQILETTGETAARIDGVVAGRTYNIYGHFLPTQCQPNNLTFYTIRPDEDTIQYITQNIVVDANKPSKQLLMANYRAPYAPIMNWVGAITPTISLVDNTNTLLLEKVTFEPVADTPDSNIPESDVRSVAEAIELTAGCTIFTEALKKTGWYDTLYATHNPDYQSKGKVYYWIDNGTYYSDPDASLKGFTVLVEGDEVLQSAGIISVDRLYQHAAALYGTEDPQNYTSPRNALNRYMAYHIQNKRMNYLTPDVFKQTAAKGHVSMRDVAEYSETLLPHSLIKITLPLNDESQSLRINYDRARNLEGLGLKSLVAYEAYNGVFHLLDGVMKNDDSVLAGERMRHDVGSLIPEFVTGGLRWNGYTNPDGSREYVALPNGFSDHLTLGENCNLIYLKPNYTWHNVNGDEFDAVGLYDFTLQMPPIPVSGKYEIRFGFRGESKRGIANFYFGTRDNLALVEDSVNLEIVSAQSITETGWVADIYRSEDGEIIYTDANPSPETLKNDSIMRSRGWMKAPTSWLHYANNDGTGSSYSLRSNNRTLRRIVGRFDMQKEKTYYLRIKNVTGDDTKQFHLDYIEIVPESVYDGETYEDWQ